MKYNNFKNGRNVMNYHILKGSIVFNYDRKTITIDRSHQYYTEIVEALKAGNFEEIKSKIDIGDILSKFANDTFTYYEGKIYSYGKCVSGYMGDKILEFYHNSLPFDNLIKFWNNLQLNPSEESRENLYRFLESNSFPLTDDGCFIAYKRITAKYTDFYTDTIDNSVGKCVSVNRDNVDPDSNVTCSHGLHIASYNYAQNLYQSGSGVLVEVKVNPRDVVAVPYDYDNQKCRVCKYEVLAIVDCENSNSVVNVSHYEDDDELSHDDDLLTDDDYCLMDNENWDDDNDKISNPPHTSNTIIRIGNYDYGLTNTSNEFVSTLQYTKRKKSRWPTAFESDRDIHDIYRCDIGGGRFIYKVLTKFTTYYAIPTTL